MSKKLAAVTASLLISAAASGADPLAELAWMAGQWAGKDGPIEMEEIWIEPRGGLMLGVHRDVKAGKAVSYEFLRIEATPQGITYFAIPQGKSAPTPFRLVESKGRRAVFANPEHDFPKRVIYWLGDDGSLHARVEGNPGDKEQAMEWAWRKK